MLEFLGFSRTVAVPCRRCRCTVRFASHVSVDCSESRERSVVSRVGRGCYRSKIKRVKKINPQPPDFRPLPFGPFSPQGPHKDPASFTGAVGIAPANSPQSPRKVPASIPPCICDIACVFPGTHPRNSNLPPRMSFVMLAVPSRMFPANTPKVFRMSIVR